MKFPAMHRISGKVCRSKLGSIQLGLGSRYIIIRTNMYLPAYVHMYYIWYTYTVVNICMCVIVCRFSAEPKFSAPITNVTAPVGREAILACVVQDLSTYKVMIT